MCFQAALRAREQGARLGRARGRNFSWRMPNEGCREGVCGFGRGVRAGRRRHWGRHGEGVTTGSHRNALFSAFDNESRFWELNAESLARFQRFPHNRETQGRCTHITSTCKRASRGRSAAFCSSALLLFIRFQNSSVAMAVPTLNFTLHVAPTDDVAEGEGDMDSLFPHTPRNDASWFEADPPAELIEQCLRPGHCVVPEGEVCEWFHRKLAQLGHAFNEVGNTLMAHTWFECAYAARASSADLISAANMRLKLGQWALVEQLYLQIVRMVLTDAQREIVERKLNDVAALKAGSAPMPGACAPGPRTRCMQVLTTTPSPLPTGASAPGPSVPQDELASLVAAADDAAARVPASFGPASHASAHHGAPPSPHRYRPRTRSACCNCSGRAPSRPMRPATSRRLR